MLPALKNIYINFFTHTLCEKKTNKKNIHAKLLNLFVYLHLFSMELESVSIPERSSMTANNRF